MAALRKKTVGGCYNNPVNHYDVSDQVAVGKMMYFEGGLG